MKYLLDTNICIFIIKKQPEKLLKKFTSHHLGDIGISSITLSELAYGVNKSLYTEKNLQALELFLAPLEIVPFDHLAAMHYGEIRAHLEKAGKIIGAMDLLIAAHAKSLGVTLVTNNKKEFARVPHLTIEDWAH